MLAQKEGTLRAAGFDQRDRLWAFRPVSGTNWIAYASVDAEAAIAPARSRALGTLLLIAVIVGATVAVGRLCGAANSATDQRDRGGRTSQGERRRDARAEIAGPREVADVGVAFNALIDTRERAHSGTRSRPGEAATAIEPPGPAAPDHPRDRRAS